MRCCTAMLATAVCWGLSDGVLAIGGQAEQANPFDAPILPVRPRVFIRADETFEGLTIAKLRQARQQPDLAQFVRKWPSKPLGRALLWLTDGKPEDLAAAIAGLKRMEAAGQSWSDRGLALMELSALLDWLWAELDEPTRRQVVAKIEKAADEAVQHIRGGQAPFFYSRTPGALAGLCLAAIALKGESQKADGYLEVFRQYGPGEYFKAYQWVDGAATGATYTIYYTYVDLPAIAAAWWSATGKNPNAWIRQTPGRLAGRDRTFLPVVHAARLRLYRHQRPVPGPMGQSRSVLSRAGHRLLRHPQPTWPRLGRALGRPFRPGTVSCRACTLGHLSRRRTSG